MPHRLLEQVRRLFSFCCGYCGSTEVETSGELTVDHFHPLAEGGADDEANLVYACFRCNGYKGDYWPDTPDAIERILHPLRDDFTAHYREEKNGELVALTPTGAFHINRLHLNRPQLVTRRLQRRLTDVAIRKQEMLEAEVLCVTTNHCQAGTNFAPVHQQRVFDELTPPPK